VACDQARYSFHPKELAVDDPGNLENTLSDIRLALKRHEGQSKSGAKIHEIIMDAAPNLNIRSVVGIPTGPGALTKFIETYLHRTVKRIGKQGGDILYGIGDNVVPPPQIEDTNIWKAFVSPNAVNHLCLKMSDMRLFVTKSLDDVDDNTHHIARVTEDEHAAIRQEFRSSLSDSQCARIDAQTEQSRTYDVFVQALRSNGLLSLWGKYRRDSFGRLLAERLEQIPVAGELIPSVVDQLMGSQRALFEAEQKKSLPTPTPPTIRSWEDRTLNGGSNLDSARSIARVVIAHMSYDEIRAIHLPLGAVLDALNARK
jgi:hypothetical protein